MYVEKRNGLGNRFTENWVIKLSRRFHGKLLICFQANFFAFPRTWLPPYVSLDKAMFLVFWICHFFLQIKRFPWGLQKTSVFFCCILIHFILFKSSLWYFHANTYWVNTSTYSGPFNRSVWLIFLLSKKLAAAVKLKIANFQFQCVMWYFYAASKNCLQKC